MAIIFVIAVSLLLIIFIFSGINRWRRDIRYPETVQYGLIIDKWATTDGHHMISFQIRDEVTQYEVSAELYQKITPPVRGALKARGKLVISFES